MSTPEVPPSPPEVPPAASLEQKLQEQIAAKIAVEQRLKGSVAWFYWIAALSLITSITVMGDGKVHFIIGLGVTTVVDAVAKQADGIGLAAGMVINVFVA